MTHDYQSDIDAVARIDAVSTILDVACRTTGMGFAAVARVTEDRWIACQVLDKIDFGLKPGGELEVATTICNEIRQSGDAVVIDHVTEDEAFSGHPTPAMYGFQSYISMPIVRRDGSFFGTLCAIDPKPARLRNEETVGMFKLFAQLIASQLDDLDYIAKAEAGLASERQIAELRDQFIAVLGHDLRNPVAAVGAGAGMLLKTPLNPKAVRIVTLMQGSVTRMTSLIDNVMDFARGRLGGGIELKRSPGDVEATLQLVIDELQAANPERKIVRELAVDGPLNLDLNRIAQLFSNLLANALSHGDADQPVRVAASVREGVFELSVANGGDPIPPEQQQDLFEPFARPKGEAGRQGLGLGLYIANQIAKAHGGDISVSSGSAETRFTLRVPIG
ncbi:MAG TPA: GAF domain-containing sensor histidine kinase [Devosia sp.]|jgi:signal transduction histidine kinase|nr:GAF domain-containing sensor histidine kinase [Devosia sp.]